MVAVFSFLAVVTVSLVIVRVATVALTLTGLSHQLARFQARSAFTGAGFTTAESENVVKHPVRRRIIMLLMLMGNAGIVTAISSFMLSVVEKDQQAGLMIRGGLLVSGLAILWWLASSDWVDQQLTRVISWGLANFSDVEARDYAGLLHLTGGFVVAEMRVSANDWLSDQTLKDLNLSAEGVLVLGVERRNGDYLGAPRGNTGLTAGDTLLLYGRKDVIQELDQRGRDRQGAWQHIVNIEQQKEREVAEARHDLKHAITLTP